MKDIVNISFILFLKNPRGARYHLYVEKFSLHSNYFNASCIILTKKNFPVVNPRFIRLLHWPTSHTFSLVFH